MTIGSKFHHAGATVEVREIAEEDWEVRVVFDNGPPVIEFHSSWSEAVEAGKEIAETFTE